MADIGLKEIVVILIALGIVAALLIAGFWGSNTPGTMEPVAMESGSKCLLDLDYVTVTGEIITRPRGEFYLHWMTCVYQVGKPAQESTPTLFYLTNQTGGEEFLVSVIEDKGQEQKYELRGTILAEEPARLGLRLVRQAVQPEPVLQEA